MKRHFCNSSISLRKIFCSLLGVMLAGVLFVTSGCTLAPNYTRPEMPVPDSWPSGPAYGEAKKDVADIPASEIKWQEFFSDSGLRRIIEMALKNNRDLRLAALNVELARALYGIRRAELLPTVDVSASMARTGTSSDLLPEGEPRITRRYAVDLGIVSWEIDFFGRVRSLKDAALYEFFATEQAQRSAQVSLVSAVANAYLTLAADRELLKLAQNTLTSQEASYNLIRRRYELGASSQLDLRQAQTRVDSARVDISRYTGIVAMDQNALTLLVGSPVPEGLLPTELKSVTALEEISAGLSSDVLLHRPDILQAENQLRAANANIGAARAAFFPSISLTATVGTASKELSGLFTAGADTWSFIPQAVMPIFDPRTWSALDASKVDKQILLTQYEKAIQVAFREVSDALAQRGTLGSQAAAQESLVEATADTYRLSDLRYRRGIDSYLNVLDAQRSLYAAQQGMISVRLARFANFVTLYKALGGGMH